MRRLTQRGQLHSRRATLSQHASTSQAISSQERSQHVSQLSQTDSVVPETITPSIAGEGQPLSEDQQDLADHDMNEIEQQLERSADGRLSTRHRDEAVRIVQRYKKRRGMHQYDGPNHIKLMVVKCNAFGQPIGKTTAKVSTEIGIIARDGSKVPLSPCKWPKISPDVKDTIWKLISAKFSFENCTDKTKRWVLTKACDCWKQWKHNLFRAYHRYDRPLEQQYEHTDDGVDKAQWRMLVQYWRSENFKKVSAQNKSNRARLKMIHRCGTMSFARKWEEEREKNPNGQEPDRMQMFKATYTLSDGLFPQPEAAKRYEQMEQLTQPTDGREGMNREEAFTDVMGWDGHGRAKMYEVGVTRKMLRNAVGDEANANVRELVESHELTKHQLVAAHDATAQELVATKEKLAATEAKLETTTANLETTNRKVDTLTNDMEAFRAFMSSMQPLMGSATQPSGVNEREKADGSDRGA